jgi:UDP-GlcNAc3NAcA epimerase
MAIDLHIITIVGARPQFIKAAAVSRAIVEYNGQSDTATLQEKIIHTGQHYDENMSQIFFEELEIPQPDRNLEVGSGAHGQQTGEMLAQIETVLLEEKPDWVLIYGDTNSTLAGALAAAKLHIPVAHVEAGLRSFNQRMPEEINRVLADHVSRLLFCPTDTAVKNLAHEGITQGVCRTGDVMYDCVLFYTQKAKSLEQQTLQSLNVQPKSYYLTTIHRAENTDDPHRLSSIVEALNEIARDDCPVILPLHPRTIGYLEKYNMKFFASVQVIPPVSYLKMVVLENNARVILTDSGGVQKEAYFHAVPCVTLRDETEWVETVASGWNTLTGADARKIIAAVGEQKQRQDITADAIYGNGDAARNIAHLLAQTVNS